MSTRLTTLALLIVLGAMTFPSNANADPVKDLLYRERALSQLSPADIELFSIVLARQPRLIRMLALSHMPPVNEIAGMAALATEQTKDDPKAQEALAQLTSVANHLAELVKADPKNAAALADLISARDNVNALIVAASPITHPSTAKEALSKMEAIAAKIPRGALFDEAAKIAPMIESIQKTLHSSSMCSEDDSGAKAAIAVFEDTRSLTEAQSALSALKLKASNDREAAAQKEQSPKVSEALTSAEIRELLQFRQTGSDSGKAMFYALWEEMTLPDMAKFQPIVDLAKTQVKTDAKITQALTELAIKAQALADAQRGNPTEANRIIMLQRNKETLVREILGLKHKWERSGFECQTNNPFLIKIYVTVRDATNTSLTPLVVEWAHARDALVEEVDSLATRGDFDALAVSLIVQSRTVTAAVFNLMDIDTPQGSQFSVPSLDDVKQLAMTVERTEAAPEGTFNAGALIALSLWPQINSLRSKAKIALDGIGNPNDLESVDQDERIAREIYYSVLELSKDQAAFIAKLADMEVELRKLIKQSEQGNRDSRSRLAALVSEANATFSWRTRVAMQDFWRQWVPFVRALVAKAQFRDNINSIYIYRVLNAPSLKSAEDLAFNSPYARQVRIEESRDEQRASEARQDAIRDCINSAGNDQMAKGNCR